MFAAELTHFLYLASDAKVNSFQTHSPLLMAHISSCPSFLPSLPASSAPIHPADPVKSRDDGASELPVQLEASYGVAIILQGSLKSGRI